MNLFQNPTQGVATVLSALVLTAVIVGAGVSLLRVLGPVPLSVSQTVTQKMSTFDVTGESEMVTVPDQAEVTAGIVVNETTVAAAQDKANEIINDINKAMDDMGIDKKDIQTQNYYVGPEYDYNNNGVDKIKGYSVSADLRIRVTDFEKLNEVIDTSTRLGANRINGISFSLTNEKEEEMLKQAREEAIEDAKDDADELAGLAGIKLGKVVNVYESRPMQPPYMPMYGRANVMMDMAAQKESTQIEPGSATYTYTVTLSYETL